MKTAIMAHGLHVEAYGWEEVVWGIPPDRLGRATKAILLAIENDASLVIFGTGASKRDGVFEAQCIVNLMWGRFSGLKEFQAFEDYNLDSLRQIMKQISVVETRSTSTLTEIQYGFARCVEQEVGRVILTSSPGHIPRCQRDALEVRDQNPKYRHLRIPAEASDVNMFQDQGGRVVEVEVTDTAIFEPAHRGDDPSRDIPADLQPNRLFPRIFRVPGKAQCLNEIAEVFHRHGA